MAKWGSVDYKQLQTLADKLKSLETDPRIAQFCEECSKELAARLLALVIPRTPVGVYPAETGKKGGTLRRGWTGERKTDPRVYANSLPVSKDGNTYTIEIINPVYYASYVEFGHRQMAGRYVPAIGKQLKANWVNGKYMLTISEGELEQIAPRLLAQKLERFLEEIFDGT